MKNKQLTKSPQMRSINKKTIWIISASVLAALLIIGGVFLTIFLVDKYNRNVSPEREVFRYEDFDYIIKDDNRIEIIRYVGTDNQLDIPYVINDRLVTSIGASAFRDTGVTELRAGAAIASVGDYAFSGCGNLKSVEFADKLVFIGKYAFEKCISLEEITLSDSLTSLGEGAFSSSALTSATLPATITEIPSSLYSTCTKLETINISASVVSVGDYAFYECAAVESINILSAVNVGKQAFAYCASLESVSLGKSLVTLGERAFYGASALKTISVESDNPNFEVSGGALVDKNTKTLILLPSASDIETYSFPSYVESIAPYAFQNHQKLSVVILPDGLKTIGDFAFDGAKYITRMITSSTADGVNVEFPTGIVDVGCSAFSTSAPFYSGYSGEFLIVGDGILLKYKKPNAETENTKFIDGNSKTVAVTIPSGVKKIATAFAWVHGVVSVKAPASLTEIGAYSFKGAVSLVSVDLTETNLSKIGSQAFGECVALKNISFPMTQITLGDELFIECESLEEITLPVGLTRIEDKMFALCRSLSSVVIPEGVTSIGSYAFSNTPNLLSITLPKSLTKIEDFAFTCAGFVEFTLPEGVEIGKYILYNAPKLEKITIFGSGTTPVGICRWDDTSGGAVSVLKTVIIDGEYTRIGDESFYGCSSIVKIKIPSTVTEIGNAAFSGCSSLEEIEFGGTFTSVGNEAFRYAASLGYFPFTKSLTTVGDYAFAECNSLSGITLRYLTGIGEYAFVNCFGLTEIELLSLAHSVPRYAFAGCKNLTSVRLLETVTIIDTSAFSSCTSLATITLPRDLEVVGEGAFLGCTSLKNVRWNSNVKTIHKSSFAESGLESVTIPDSVTTLGASAFSSCPSLRKVVIGNGITVIKEQAFAYCTALESVIFPNSLTEIEGGAFVDTSLTSLRLEDTSVVTIGIEAFAGCQYISSVHIPKTLLTVKRGAFEDCTSLGGVYYYGEDFSLLILGTVTEGNSAFLNAGWH